MKVDLSKYVFKKITSVTPGKAERVFDIEVDSTEHAFIAQSPDGAIGISHNSALISLSNLSDDRMRSAKSGQWWVENVQRALANNSACYTEKPDIGVFMDEWKALYESRSGERGIFNLVAAKKSAEASQRRDPTKIAGTNPCVSGDTRILTDRGYVEISKVIGQKVNIWNGTEWSVVQPYSTGQNELVEITFSDGVKLKCTPYHTFILDAGRGSHQERRKEIRKQAKDLSPGDKLYKYEMPVVHTGRTYNIDAYSQGFYSGDGCVNNNRSYLYDTKYMCQPFLVGSFGDHINKRRSWHHGPMMEKSFVPVDGELDFCLNWFAGLCDSDGCVTRDKNGSGIQITSTNHEFLTETRLMLSRLGVKAKVVAGRPLRNVKIKNHEYICQKIDRLLVGNVDTHKLISLGFKTHRLDFKKISPNRDARRFVKVVSVEKLNRVEETFCFTEPKNNTGTFEGVVTGNCAEILLRNKGFCNLSEVVVREDDTKETLIKKVELATILGTFQSTLTKFRYLTKEWERNAEEERLLGVSLTGILDNKFMSTPSEELKEFLNQLREHAIEVNKQWSEKLGIPQSAAITCVKPSGTVSQLVDSASGIHARHSPYYIRTVRADIKDPLCKFMIDLGFPCEPDVTKPEHTMVFSFPVQAPENATFRDQLDAIKHLHLWLFYKKHWAEHTVSITVSVKEQEWIDVAAYVYKHFDDISGISFLPFSDHVYQQAPYQECTQEEYEALVLKLPKDVDWSVLKKYETSDMTTSSKELACVSGVCEI